MRNEYPRPDFVRSSFQSLNGEWNFAFDDNDCGTDEKWYKSHTYDKKIQVPFAYQAKLSGIGDITCHDVIWYEKEVVLEEDTKEKDVLLHFGAVDYVAEVYINGEFAGRHEGGDTPFTICMNPYLQEGSQKITVRVWDPCADETIPRGKQYWKPKAASIWYTCTSGIWQSVWIETVSKARMENARFISHFDEGKEEIKVSFKGSCSGLLCRAHVTFKEEEIADTMFVCQGEEGSVTFDVIQNHIFRTNFHNDGYSWTPEHPNLFDVTLTLMKKDGTVLDEVQSYFGFRKVHTEQQMVYLNNKPYYHKLVLDQGYWPEGLLTAPSDEALRFDIEASKALGFNGCRKHQKAEDPRFLYWADKLGYLVWGEVASVPTFGEKQIRRMMSLWSEIVERDYNHPSIVCWVPINESWGVPQVHADRQQQHYTQMLYHFLHACDSSRLVISNDGWEITETDICAIHNYDHGSEGEEKKQADFATMFLNRKDVIDWSCRNWDVYAKGFEDQGAPIMLTEFGGIGFDVNSNEQKGWGYTSSTTEEEFVRDYKRVLDVVMDSPVLSGFCYTQLTDVEQEINGLLTYDRRYKCDPKKIQEINGQYRRFRVKPEI